jgi:hypothetical protein
MLIKYVEGKSTQGGGGQEYTYTLDHPLITLYFSPGFLNFLQTICNITKDKEMGKYRAKGSIYATKDRRSEEETSQ